MPAAACLSVRMDSLLAQAVHSNRNESFSSGPVAVWERSPAGEGETEGGGENRICEGLFASTSPQPSSEGKIIEGMMEGKEKGKAVVVGWGEAVRRRCVCGGIVIFRAP